MENEKEKIFVDSIVKSCSPSEIYRLMFALNEHLPDVFKIQDNDYHKTIKNQIELYLREAHAYLLGVVGNNNVEDWYKIFHDYAARVIEHIPEELKVYNVMWNIDVSDVSDFIGCSFSYSIVHSTHRFTGTAKFLIPASGISEPNSDN